MSVAGMKQARQAVGVDPGAARPRPCRAGGNRLAEGVQTPRAGSGGSWQTRWALQARLEHDPGLVRGRWAPAAACAEEQRNAHEGWRTSRVTTRCEPGNGHGEVAGSNAGQRPAGAGKSTRGAVASFTRSGCAEGRGTPASRRTAHRVLLSQKGATPPPDTLHDTRTPRGPRSRSARACPGPASAPARAPDRPTFEPTP